MEVTNWLLKHDEEAEGSYSFYPKSTVQCAQKECDLSFCQHREPHAEEVYCGLICPMAVPNKRIDRNRGAVCLKVNSISRNISREKM